MAKLNQKDTFRIKQQNWLKSIESFRLQVDTDNSVVFDVTGGLHGEESAYEKSAEGQLVGNKLNLNVCAKSLVNFGMA